MARYRDFDAARAEQHREPLTFRLGGEEFTITGALPAGVLLDIAAAQTSNDQEAMFGAIVGMWDQLVAPVDQERFAQAIRRVDMETMLALVEWVVEETTGRPFGSPSSSPEESFSDGQASRVVSLSPGREARSA